MPAIRIKEGEPAVPLEKAITLRDFLTITRDVDKALILMRKTCLEGRDVVCATYKDQIGHYVRLMLGPDAPGTRGPVGSMLRRMGKPEYETVKDIEDLWFRVKKEYPDIVELEGRAGPEFLEEELLKKWEERLAGMIGPERWKRVQEIQRSVEVEELPPAPPEAEAEELKEMIEAEEAILMRMREELRRKLERMKGE